MTAQTQAAERLAVVPQERRPRLGGHSPWGAIDHIEPGPTSALVWVSTSSHGGLWVSRGLLDSTGVGGRLLRSYHSFAGGPASQWYEEDLDYNAVVLAFPYLFTQREVHDAVRHAEAWDQLRTALAWLDAHASEQAAYVRQVAATWEVENRNRWRISSQWTCGRPNAWGVSFVRVGDKQRAERIVTDDELYGSKRAPDGLYDELPGEPAPEA